MKPTFMVLFPPGPFCLIQSNAIHAGYCQQKLHDERNMRERPFGGYSSSVGGSIENEKGSVPSQAAEPSSF